MTGIQRSSDGLEPRRKRLLYRAWHRGMREMDLLLGGYADVRIDALDDGELDEFAALMEAPDQELFKWLTGAEPVAANYDTAIFHDICRFHAVGSKKAST